MNMSSAHNSNGRSGPTRDDFEGTYTQVEPEPPTLRTVQGTYTKADGSDGPDPLVQGTYIGASRKGSTPLVRPARLRHGNYPKAEH